MSVWQWPSALLFPDGERRERGTAGKEGGGGGSVRFVGGSIYKQKEEEEEAFEVGGSEEAEEEKSGESVGCDRSRWRKYWEKGSDITWRGQTVRGRIYVNLARL